MLSNSGDTRYHLILHYVHGHTDFNSLFNPANKKTLVIFRHMTITQSVYVPSQAGTAKILMEYTLALLWLPYCRHLDGHQLSEG